MLKIDRTRRTFTTLPNPTLRDAGLLERQDLQACIMNSSEAFFAELGLDLFPVGEEVRPSADVEDRIDVLGVDRQGAAVIVELKRGENKLHLLQAVAYAGMVARWGSDAFEELLGADDWDRLVDFLDVEPDEINRRQRLVLVAEGFDYALLSGAEWLTEQHGVDLTCCTVSLAVDPETRDEYLACASVYPPPALAEQATARGRRSKVSRPMRWENWEAALDAIVNEDVRAYVAEQLRAGRENRLHRRSLFFRQHGKRRWNLHCRGDRAYVWQKGRFEDDEAFWTDRLGPGASPEPVNGGRALRFYLHSSEELRAFHGFVTDEVAPMDWQDP